MSHEVEIQGALATHQNPFHFLNPFFQERGVKFDKGPRAHDLKERK